MFRIRQLTFGKYGHMLNCRQAISANREWAVYDTRNDDTHIARTDAIEMVRIESGEIVRLYQTKNQAVFGPGVGAVSHHPTDQKIIFIHGIESCSAINPYSVARRFGAIVDTASPMQFVHAESRLVANNTVSNMPKLGTLAGGTHAHSWSQDGWISFTYNDAFLDRQSQLDNTVRNLRTVGFMVPGLPVENTDRVDGQESFHGTFAAFIAVNVQREALNGSDDVEQALEECWVGQNGYVDAHGIHHEHALAFQGTIRDREGKMHNEIFVCDLPSLNEIRSMVDQASPARRENGIPCVPGCVQRRLTFSLNRKYPGVQGPRNWLVASVDGSHIYFPMRDDNGIVQVFRVATVGGEAEQVSSIEHSIEGQVSLDRMERQCAFLSNQSLCLLDLQSGIQQWLTPKSEYPLFGAVHFVDDKRWIFNGYVGNEADRYAQIFVCE